MLKISSLILAAVLGTGVSSAARADLTVNGAVGMPLNPTAETTGALSVQGQASYFDLGSVGGNDVRLYGLHGAGRLLNRLEISGGVEKMSADRGANDLDRTGIALGAKYTLLTAPIAGVSVAAGAGYSRAVFENTHAYLVATKPFPGIGTTRFTGHLGVRYDRFKIGGSTSNRASVYGGAELPLSVIGSDNLALIGEMQSKNADFSDSRTPYSLSLRYRPAGRPFSARVGWQRQGVTGDSGVFAQANLGF